MNYENIVNWLNCRKYNVFVGAKIEGEILQFTLEDSSGFQEMIEIPLESITIIKRRKDSRELTEAEKVGDA